MKAECYDCKLPYTESWADVVIPDDIWKLIAPVDGDGLLCFNCMNARLHALGSTNVPYYIANGPFRLNTTEQRQATELADHIRSLIPRCANSFTEI